MPEYSSTTITPADSVKVPAMNGGSSGNFQLDALRNFILASKGQANGLASLGADGKLTAAQLPDLADDVLVYGSYALLPSPGIAGKLYITADDNKMYRWDDALTTPDYVVLSVDLSAYATKAEMEAADTDLKNALTAVDHRVQNLESAKGDYVAVDSDKGVISVPSGKGKWAVVEKLKGVTRGKNNIAVNGNFATGDMTGWTDVSGGTRVIADNKITYTWPVQFSNNGLQNSATIIANHTYLIFATIKNLSGDARAFRLGQTYGVQTASFSIANGSTALVCGVITPTTVEGNGTKFGLLGTQTTNYSCEMSDFVIRDLFIHFGTSDLSFLGATDSAKLATIQTYYPWLLEPSDYGNSLVDSVYEGVKSVGVNINNEDYEEGVINAQGQPSSSSVYFRSKTFFDIEPLTRYWYKCDANHDDTVFFYDEDKNFIEYTPSVIANTYFDTPANARYAKLTRRVGYGTEIQICLNSYSAKTTYHPYMTDTLTLPTPITLRSAGSVAEEFDLETGEKTNPLGSYTFTADEGWTAYYAPGGTYRLSFPSMKGSSVNATILGYTFYDNYTSWGNASDKALYMSADSFLYVKNVACTSLDLIKAEMAGKTIIYELATPNDPTQLTPIQNPTILTESGGTISAQTEEPIDGNFSVGFITL